MDGPRFWRKIGDVPGHHREEDQEAYGNKKRQPLSKQMRVSAMTKHYSDRNRQHDETESTDENNVEGAEAILWPERFDRDAGDYGRDSNAERIAKKAATTPRYPRNEVNQDDAESNPTGDRGYTSRLSNESSIDNQADSRGKGRSRHPS
jgi:hypothetical protein